MADETKDIFLGMNLNATNGRLKKGQVSFAMSAITEGFDGQEVHYQNEQASELCAELPQGFKVVGRLNILDEGFILVFLHDPILYLSEIGKIKDCVYSTIINPKCLNFSLDDPILKIEYKKTECSLEVYWASKKNPRRYIDLYNLPYKTTQENCDTIVTNEIDCNKLNVQPDFSIPKVDLVDVDIDGELKAGTVQFAVQYANSNSESYTSFYSVTNPVPIFDATKVTADFNYPVNKSIKLNISNIDTTGYYDYINVAVIETINGITTPYIVGTYDIIGSTRTIIYSGQKSKDLNIEDIFEKYPIYKYAEDVTTAQDILIWSQLSGVERVNYQQIANKIHLFWTTQQLDSGSYADPILASKYKTEMRDEIVAYEICFLLRNGHQTDGFHIPARASDISDDEIVNNSDIVICSNGDEETMSSASVPVSACDCIYGPTKKWKTYNTAYVIGEEEDYMATGADPCYIGGYNYGEFAYWESTELYPCNKDIWGELAGLPIRHHKFPDNLVSPIHDNKGHIFPLGVKLNYTDLIAAIDSSTLTQSQKDEIVGYKILRGNRANNKSIVARGMIHNMGKYTRDNNTFLYPNYPYNDLNPDIFITSAQSSDDSGDNYTMRLDSFSTDDSKNRFVFHSPDTHFTQPSLGNILKLESVEYGESQGHFVQVKNHAKYKFLSRAAYGTAAAFAITVGFASGMYGTSNKPFDGAAAITAFQLVLDILDKTAPMKNMVYQYNSIGNYEFTKPVLNQGNKQRVLDLSQYIIPGYNNVSDTYDINNFQRESSVYLKSKKKLLFPHEAVAVPKDTSRIKNNSSSDNPLALISSPIASYYATIKRNVENQWGQIYSYQSIDTGFQDLIDRTNTTQYRRIFGGDSFINKFSYKSKFPYFIDNRVSTNAQTFPDLADVDYREFNNVAYTNYWLATNSVKDITSSAGTINIEQFLGVKVNNFDNIESYINYQVGKIYLHSYGIPTFYCESQVNVDLRQAYNNKEGDFYPHVSSGIPDDWLQETNVSIQNDNTYTYNKTYSKQNKENFFAHLPLDYSANQCRTRYPNRAIFSEQRTNIANSGQRNNWLIYKPVSFYDFPENYGKLTSLDGIENKQVLARFTNRTQLYNALLTAPTSSASVYLGKSLFSQQVPPLDYADTDLGYIGSQHKFLFKTEYGIVTVDSKRGQVFLLQGQSQPKDISGDCSKFITEFLDIQLVKYLNVNIDNHYNGVGIHGTYDNKYNRLILTKLDYKPKVTGITHENGLFYYNGSQIQLTDTKYFENLSFTLSYDFDNDGWISFHPYLPNYYVGDSNFFYVGTNVSNSIWKHNISTTRFNNFFGKIEPFIVEYPFSYLPSDEILQSIQDYSKVYKYNDYFEMIETDEDYFNKAIISSPQQTSGVLNLVQKKKNSLADYGQFPKYNVDSKDIQFTKSGGVYQYNQFWGLVKDVKKPLWIKSNINLSYYKELNQPNMDYSKRSFKKEPLRTKDLKVRHILDNRDDIKIVSQILTTNTTSSKK